MKPSCSTLFLISVLLNFYACRQPERNDETTTENSQSKDITEKIYLTNDLDTNETVSKLSMYNEKYSLRIKRYCLNDSAVINEVVMLNDSILGRKRVLNISHNYATQIILTKDNKLVIAKEINKEIFKDSLNSQFYIAGILSNVQYDFVRTNRLYFSATISIPQTDQNEDLQFAVFYQTDKIGQLDFWRGKRFAGNH